MVSVHAQRTGQLQSNNHTLDPASTCILHISKTQPDCNWIQHLYLVRPSSDCRPCAFDFFVVRMFVRPRVHIVSFEDIKAGLDLKAAGVLRKRLVSSFRLAQLR